MLEASLRTKLQRSILSNVNHDRSLHSLPATNTHDKCTKWLETLDTDSQSVVPPSNKENVDADADIRPVVGNKKTVHHIATSFASIGKNQAHTTDKKYSVDQQRTGAKRKLFSKCKHVTDEIGVKVRKRRSQAVDSLSGIETICAGECSEDREQYSNYGKGQPIKKYKRKPFGIVENCAHDVQLESQKMTQQQQPVPNQTEVELGFASISLDTVVQQLPTENQVLDTELSLPCEGQETTEQQQPAENQVLDTELSLHCEGQETTEQQQPAVNQVLDTELSLHCEGQETTEQQQPAENQVLNIDSVATMQQPYEVLPSQLYMLTTVGDQQVLVPVSVACLSDMESVSTDSCNDLQHQVTRQ